jgi:hypothetical protein
MGEESARTNSATPNGPKHQLHHQYNQHQQTPDQHQQTPNQRQQTPSLRQQTLNHLNHEKDEKTAILSFQKECCSMN